jgi:hypothetical protein
MNFKKFPISQSIIKLFLHNGEEKQYCFRRIFLTKIVRSLPEQRTEPMMKGKYFETYCLGKSSGGEIYDLPRKGLTKKELAENAVRKVEKKPLLLGQKTLDHIRIDDQITRFKALANKNKVVIADYNVQVPIITRWDQDPDIFLSAELDIFPTTILLPDEEDDNIPKLFAAIIDLKLTSDIHNTFGEYCYGSPEYLDLIQAKMYHYCVRKIDKDLNPGLTELITESVQKLIDQNRILFLLWIFNYKGKVLEDKFIKVSWDCNKLAELNESIRKTIGCLEMGEKLDWPTNPEFHMCKSCPWTDCPDKIKIQTV